MTKKEEQFVLWENFTNSGSVFDYLKYIDSVKSSTNSAVNITHTEENQKYDYKN